MKYVWVNTPKSQKIESSSRTRKIGRISGYVTRQNDRHGPAPSTRAASTSSAGMVFSPASTVTAMNGKLIQTTSAVSTVYAGRAPLVVQLNPAQWAPPPSQPGSLLSVQSTIPPSGLNSQKNTTEALTTGVAQASSAAVLTNVAILRPRWCRSRPTSVPTTRVSTTTTIANTTVIRSASQNSESVRMLVKLLKPTHWVGAAPETWPSP